MRSLITGVNGFVGIHLLRALKARGDEVWGIYHPDTDAGPVRREFRDVHLNAVDIMDNKGLNRSLKRAAPDRIFHLAAQSHVPTSWEDPEGTFRINVFGSLNLLKAAARKTRPPRILLVSSGDVYGDVSGVKGVLKEDTLLRPLNPYSASKAAMEWMACAAAISLKTPVLCVRPFNHIGPGQSPSFVASDFARQIALIEAGRSRPVIRVGNLEASKNFTDVRDMVRAYVLALEKCPPGGVYNLGSAKSYTIREILDILLGFSSVSPDVVVERARMRASTSSVVKVSSARFKKLTGWKPRYTIRRTLKDILEYWRESLKSGD